MSREASASVRSTKQQSKPRTFLQQCSILNWVITWQLDVHWARRMACEYRSVEATVAGDGEQSLTLVVPPLGRLTQHGPNST